MQTGRGTAARTAALFPSVSLRAGRLALAVAAGAMLAACTGPAHKASFRYADQATSYENTSLASYTDSSLSHKPAASVSKTPAATPSGGGIFKVGKPYKIAGKWYTPSHDPDYDNTGMASWYGSDFHGKRTANGEQYNMESLTAAHPTLPLPSYVKVTNLDNGRTLIVRVNDRGPYKRGRIIDLSRKAATLLGYKGQGVAKVRVQYVKRAPLDGDTSYERQYLAQQPWYRSQMASTDAVPADLSAMTGFVAAADSDTATASIEPVGSAWATATEAAPVDEASAPVAEPAASVKLSSR